MNKITLFEAAQLVRDALKIDPETGEIDESYVASRELFEQKGEACIAYLQDRKAASAARKEMLKKASEHVAAEERHIEHFEGYVWASIRAAGISRISTPDGLMTATLTLDCVKSVEIDEGATFPPALCNDPKPPTPRKTKIKAAIEAGEPVAGARIVYGDRFIVK